LQYQARAAEIVKETRDILRQGSRSCGRTVTSAEIERALKKAWDVFEVNPLIGVQLGKEQRKSAPKWPTPSREKIEEVCQQYAQVGVGSLEEESPVKNPRRLAARDILPMLFRPEEFVCLGEAKNSFGTWVRDEALWRAEGCRYIVPNPFKAARGLTLEGKPTVKSNSQVLCRRFVINEFDFRGVEWAHGWSLEEKIACQARLHWHLAHRYPLVLIVYSGNESLHGWYGASRVERDNRQLLAEAVELGADHHLWVPSQFTRLPGAVHQNGRRQDVIYFAPERVKL
jgi:hypothetical protein